jgi:hypothetical protein
MAVQTQIQTRRGTAASWTSTNPTLAAGEIGFESDTGKIKIGTGSTAWNALAYTASSTAVTYLFNATGGQTTFSGTDANGLTLAYTVGAEQVYLNGVLQVRGSDYTATNGTSIVLTSGALVSDVLNVIAFSALALSDTYTQAQADAKFFQNANAFVAGKNKIINGDFAINQRNYSSGTSGAYVVDRFYSESVTGTCTSSVQQFSPGTAPVSGYEAKQFIRYVISGQSATNALAWTTYAMEDVRNLAGQTTTISFWAKAASGTPKIALEWQQIFGSGGSPSSQVNTYAGQVTISTSWARYSITFNVPSISGKTFGTNPDSYNKLAIWQSAGTDYNARTGSIGVQNNTFDIWGMQVEAGSIATAFQTATGTIQGELAACQRYYYKLTTGTLFASLGLGAMLNTSQMELVVPFGTEMRTAPSLDQATGSAYYGYQLSAGNQTFNAFTIDRASSKQISLYVSLSTTIGGQVGWVYANSTSTSLAFTAEL